METTSIRIPKSIVITAANAYLAGVEVHIDNWGRWNGRDWHADNSYILLPDSQKIPINIPKSPTWETPIRRWNVYVNDVTSTHITVKADGDRLKIQFHFDSAGDELKIGCINRATDEPCTTHILQHTGQFDHTRLVAWLQPRLSDNQISFTDPVIEVKFDFSFDSEVLESLRGLVDIFVDTNRLIENELSRMMARSLKEEGLSEFLAKSLNDAIFEGVKDVLKETLGNQTAEFLNNRLKIVSIKDDGSHYAVHLTYPAPVTLHSLSIMSFEVVEPRDEISCPGDVTFSATINTKHKMDGEAWLENEDGSVTARLRWSNPKNRTTTSVIARRWDQPDHSAHNGWSRLALSFKDVFGVTHTIRSSRADFVRTCRRDIGPTVTSNG